MELSTCLLVADLTLWFLAGEVSILHDRPSARVDIWITRGERVVNCTPLTAVTYCGTSGTLQTKDTTQITGSLQRTLFNAVMNFPIHSLKRSQLLHSEQNSLLQGVHYLKFPLHAQRSGISTTAILSGHDTTVPDLVAVESSCSAVVLVF